MSPFDVMSQDLEHVIMVVNFLLDSATEHKTHDDNGKILNEKEQDKAFWSAL